MADEPKTIKIWDGIIEYEEPVPDASIESANKEFQARLTAFDRHKDSLIASLQKEYKRHPVSKPFEAEKSWRDLTVLASTYIRRIRIRQKMMPAADRLARLRELSKALGRARRMADRAMQDNVGDDLFSAWYDANVRHDIVSKGSFTLVRIDDEFKKLVASLAVLESAACRAVRDVRIARGRPKGTAILPWVYIDALASLYHDKTGSKPGAGDGPFARFVFKFLTAVGQGNIEYESVIDAIKDARTQARRRSTAGCQTPSGTAPFAS